MKIKETWDKYMQGWFGSVLYVVLGFLIALGVHAALGYALHTDTPVVAVFSESMDPTFYRGDMIVVQSYSPNENISVGDVIVFDVPGKMYPIIHRVYSINGDVIMTKGDNNAVTDPWTISKNVIHGKAILKVPLLGWVKIIFTEATGLG